MKFCKLFGLITAFDINRDKDVANMEHISTSRTSSSFPAPPKPNLNFVFHNKLPKSGSTTMKYIISSLSKQNDFILDYQSPCLDKTTCATNLNDGIGGETDLIKHVKMQQEKSNQKYILLKHQYYLNFTDFGMEQPTMINVVRDPITRFSSMYYFNRFGFASMGSKDRIGQSRHVWKGKESDISQSLDECVENMSDECHHPLQVLVRYFCGTKPECAMKSGQMGLFGSKNDWSKVQKAALLARHNILHNYFAIGIMEDFELTLTLFEKMIPSFFSGAQAAYQSKLVQTKRDSSKTAAHKSTFSNSTRKFLEEGPLRYEMDLYNLIKSVFNQRLTDYGLI